MKKGSPKFRSQFITMTMATCICSILVLGITLILIFVSSFSKNATNDMKFYLENTTEQFDLRLQYLEDIITACGTAWRFRTFLTTVPLTTRGLPDCSPTTVICFPHGTWWIRPIPSQSASIFLIITENTHAAISIRLLWSPGTVMTGFTRKWNPYSGRPEMNLVM